VYPFALTRLIVLFKFRILQNTLSSISCLCKKLKTERRPNFASFELTGGSSSSTLFKISSSLRTSQTTKPLSIAANFYLYLIQFTFNRRVSYKRYMNIILSHKNGRNKLVKCAVSISKIVKIRYIT
jgi:hypothetical protein